MIKRDEFPFGADQMIKLKLEAFLISLVRGSKDIQPSSRNEIHEQSRLEAIHQYITENYTEKILLDNICFIFGTNKTSLCQDFKNEYKTTFVSYINSLKIKEAKALLRENELTVTEISEKLGFNSIHYFSRLFKTFNIEIYIYLILDKFRPPQSSSYHPTVYLSCLSIHFHVCKNQEDKLASFLFLPL